MKWAIILLMTILSACSQSDVGRIPLTPEELAYIANKPTITWAVESRPPFIPTEPQIVGISQEYMDIIAKKTGLTFLPVGSGTSRSVTTGRITVLATVKPMSHDDLSFTPPFTYTSGILILRTSISHQPLTIGVKTNSSASVYLASKFPRMNLITKDSNEELLGILGQGKLDGVVLDKVAAQRLIRNTPQFRIIAMSYEYPYAFAYEKENAILGNILTKAMKSITTEERERISSNWN